ncbi:hypothetical protein CLOP_g19746 [Closterium sp. NIES-67]|nr:hypothetical protein CLOP_g19746 [Closterium sp. NIES-67]
MSRLASPDSRAAAPLTASPSNGCLFSSRHLSPLLPVILLSVLLLLSPPLLVASGSPSRHSDPFSNDIDSRHRNDRADYQVIAASPGARRRLDAGGGSGAVRPSSVGGMAGGTREGWGIRGAGGRGDVGDGGRSRIGLRKVGGGRANAGRANVKLAESQVSALVQLNAAWGGTWPGNSNATTACRQWAGVTCNAAGYVTALQLHYMQVVNGSIPSALVQLSLLRTLNLSKQAALNSTLEFIPPLTNLQVLDLRYANFYGPIPEAIGNLTALSHLDLHTWSLNGTFPSTIGALSLLTYLDLGELVPITGPFSNLTWLSSLTSLQYLSLAHNDMYGELPPLTFSLLQKLTSLDLSSLKFGSFPNWITVLSGLKYLNLHGLIPDDRPFFRTAIVPQDLSKLASLESFDAAMNGLLGVLPDSWASLVNLTSLTLSSNNISGSIPLSFSNLTNLRSLALDANQMSGQLIQALSTNLESVALALNQFDGPIPSVLVGLPRLTALSIESNRFSGNIPTYISRLSSIQYLNLGGNQLTGGLSSLFPMTWLTSLELMHNQFSGPVPLALSRLSNLNLLALAFNNFTGTFPAAALQIPSLSVIDLGYNQFSGPIPAALSRLSFLQGLTLNFNRFTGIIPPALHRISSLGQLMLAGNRLSGPIPQEIRNWPTLYRLDLRYNQFTGSLPNFTAWNTTSLGILYLGSNNLTGPIPESIGNLTSLQLLSLDSNRLTGSLPVNISALTQLSALSLGNNAIIGPVADTLANLTSLETLWLFGNNLTGTIPSSLCNLTRMNSLVLRNNLFYGTMPSCLVNFASLRDLDLSNNSLTGPMNRNMKGMNPAYSTLNVAHNFFYGDPTLFANGTLYCPDQVEYNASFYDFQVTGRDYMSSGGQGAYQKGRASLRDNCFDMTVAADSCVANETQRSAQECLTYCGLTANSLPCAGHGMCVPAAAAAAAAAANGSSDTSAAAAGGNASVVAGSAFTCLCDDGYYLLWLDNGTPTCSLTPPVVPPAPVVQSSLSTGAIIAIVVGCCVALAIVAAAVAAVLILRKQKKRRTWTDLDVCKEYSIEEVRALTNNWDAQNILGEGGFATVYRGVNAQGHVMAVKRVKLMSNDFETEVRAMATLHHKNLVRLLGFCLHMDVETAKQEQVLVYEYVPNRDLDHHIRSPKQPLSLEDRLKIALGAAEGLAYLHSFETPIIHRDIKPSNILVTDTMEAKIGDFGLLKQLKYEADGSNVATKVAGTPGYVDPDYNRTAMVTTKSDVYSFGVVLLEILTGQPVTIDRTCHIGKWASMKLHDYQIEELKDKTLTASEDAVLELADIALDCIKRRAAHRPDMTDVVLRLAAMVREYCAREGQEGAEGGGGGEGEGEGRERPGLARLGRKGSNVDYDVVMGGGRSSGGMTLRSEIESLCANSEIMERNKDSMVAGGSSYVGLQQGPSAR